MPTVLEFLDKDTGQHGILYQKAAISRGLSGFTSKGWAPSALGLSPFVPNMVASIFTGYSMTIGLCHQGYTDAIRSPGHRGHRNAMQLCTYTPTLMKPGFCFSILFVLKGP